MQSDAPFSGGAVFLLHLILVQAMICCFSKCRANTCYSDA